MIAHEQPDDPVYHAHRSGLGPDPRSGDSAAETKPAASHPLAGLREQFGILTQQIAYYFEIHKDLFRLKVRTWLILAALGAFGAVSGVVALVVAISLVLNGVALGIAEALGGHIWAGQLITGAGVLALAAAVIYVVIRRATQTSRTLTRRKYDRLQHEQRAAAERRAAERIGDI